MATFLLVVVGWVFFRSTSVRMAATVLGGMFLWHGGAPVVAGTTLLLMITLGTAVTQFAPNTFELSHAWPAPATIGLAVLFVMCLVFIYGTKSSPFLYFQF